MCSSDRPFRFLDPGVDNNSIRVYCRNPTARDISADIEKKEKKCVSSISKLKSD